MWFDLLFKYSRETWRQADLVFAGMPALWLALIGLAGLLLIGASIARGKRLGALGVGQRSLIGGVQALVLGLVLILLAGPSLRLTELVPGANRIAVLVDDSASMALPAADGAAISRRDAAAGLLRDGLLPSLETLADVSLYRFGGDVAAMTSLDEPSTAADRTHLYEALTALADQYRDQPLTAIIVLTDGADNAPAGSRGLSRLADGVPVHAIGFGATELRGDLELVDVDLPLSARPDTRVAARALVRHAARGAAELRVWDGDALLAARSIEPPRDGGARPIAVDLRFDSGGVGVRDLRFELSPLPDEPITDNNVRRHLLTVEPRPIRVLYLEGEPRWEYRFLRLAASTDDTLDLVSWLRTSQRKTLRQGVADADDLAGGFPEQIDELFSYDLVVLGSLPAHLLDDVQHAWLEAFVAERGGAVLALAGRDGLHSGGWQRTPLAAVLPVRFGSETDATAYGAVTASVQPTRQGLASTLLDLAGEPNDKGADPQRLWSTLPELGDLARIDAIKPGATVLLEALADDGDRQWRQPLLVEQYYGRGRSAVLATASTWRWQMRTPPDDRRHHHFWRQLLRQLADSAPQQAQLDLTLDGGGDLTLSLALRDSAYRPVHGADVRASVRAAGERRSVVLAEVPGGSGEYLGLVEAALGDGRGRIRVDVDASWPGGNATQTRFLSRATATPEAFSAAQDRPALERVAERTGGRYWRPAEAGALPDALRFAGSGVTERRLLDLWNMPAALLLLFLLKTTEWLLRRRWGVL